ncbi:hypothetical protein [Halobacteriovorax sp. FRX-2]|uniref:hypothetical protein n=1 Tax=Halobacteriovorax sp. FRX-2 TaxID=3157711 RepID=UPI00371D41CC
MLRDLPINNFNKIVNNLILVLYIIIPWSYIDTATSTYNFTPKYIALTLLILTFIPITVSSTNLVVKFKKAFCALMFLVLSYLINERIELNYITQIIYLELACLIISKEASSTQLLSKILRYATPLLILKCYIFRNGLFIHGGFASSNFLSLIILLSLMIEIHNKSFITTILYILILIPLGSKTAYISLILLILYNFSKSSIFLKRNFYDRFSNFYYTIAFSIVITIFSTSFIASTNFYKNWINHFSIKRQEITFKNMVRSGLLKDQEFLTKDFKNKQNELKTEFPISPTYYTLNLRILQNLNIMKDFNHYFISGALIKSATKSFGFNPHNAILGFIAQLGFLYLLYLFFVFSDLFLKLDNPVLNLLLFPYLLFQPYGYTLGHGLIIISIYYVIIKKTSVFQKWKLINI